MPQDQNAPATKEDIGLLMERMGDMDQRIDGLRNDMDERFDELRDEMKTWKKELVHEFKIIAEDLRHDLIGIHKDKVEDHEQRLVRLERNAGLRAA